MPALTIEEPPALVTPARIDQAELSLLRVENSDYRMREKIAAEAFLRLRGETEQLRKQLAAEQLNNGADRRRMDLLVSLCHHARLRPMDTHGVAINTGTVAVSDPEDLRAFLDSVLNAPESCPAP